MGELWAGTVAERVKEITRTEVKKALHMTTKRCLALIPDGRVGIAPYQESRLGHLVMGELRLTGAQNTFA
jgi:hypothetical protein